MLWLVALRNLQRNRRRSVLVCSIIMFGFAAMALTAGFMAQTFEALRLSTIRGGVGHLQITPARADDGGTQDAATAPEQALDDSASIEAAVRTDARVADVLARTDFYGLVTDGEQSVPFVGAGVDPVLEARYMDAPGLIAAGHWLTDSSAREAVLGSGLARTLRVKAGESVTLVVLTLDGTLNAVDVEIVGIAQLPIRDLDDRYLATSLGTADALRDAGGRVSRLVVLLHDESATPAVARDLRAAFAAKGARVAVQTWVELAVFYRQVRYLYLGIFGFLGAVLALVVLLATANTMLMVTAERTREVGTLRALGARPARIQQLFLAEGALTALAGCLAGATLSLAVRALLNRSGIMLPPPPGVAHAVPLHINLYPAAYLLGVVAMLATVIAATWLPARRAARRPVVESLAHV